MPEKSWMDHPERCAAAGVPSEVTFKTRPQQVREMIESARTAGVPFAWFTADEEFGQNPGLCAYLEGERLPYVMGIPKNTKFHDNAGRAQVIENYVERLPPNAWQRRACGIGSKGHRIYDWTLVASAEPDLRFLIRRRLNDGELAFYRCYNPHHAGFGELVQVAGARWPIEECFGASKNETGLDNYQVRTWNAWHRHIAFSMLAHTFLAVIAQVARKSGCKTPEADRTGQPEGHTETPSPDPAHDR